MEGDPGSMSAYSRAERDMFKPEAGPGPAAYDVRSDSIAHRTEMIAPFDTTAILLPLTKSVGPGPAVYYPRKKDRWQYGSPLFRWGDRFHEKINFAALCTEAVWRRIPDPWVQMTEKVLAMSSKRPRVSYEKYVSNNIPSIYHPLSIRCFIKGIDGREYPWALNRIKSAGPANYNTYKIYTSQSKITAIVNFGAMSKRKSLFGPQIGAGPAGYFIRGYPAQDKGEFLAKRFNEPGSSAWRLFDILDRQTRKDNFGGPASTTTAIPSPFDKCSPKAVLAPFKSKTPLGFVKPAPGPGPAAHFFVEMQESDLNPSLKPGVITFPPDKAPFDTTEERFIDPLLFEMMDHPGPSDYDILGFTDIMMREIARHPAAFLSPKLGFLTSADARPQVKKKKGDNDDGGKRLPSCHCLCEKPRIWRNMRPPRTATTYGYNGRPPKFPDSPGPIYDSAPGAEAVKSHKTWLDPRHYSKTAFLNSGCMRKTDFFNIDMGIPGTGKYFSKIPCCRRHPGKQPPSGPRFKEFGSDGPGPVHKLHQKCDSSIWRASHLGTFNSNLKHVGVLFPWSGGFIKRNLNQAGDAVWKIKRHDDYLSALCPNSLEQAKQGRGDKYKSPQSQSAVSTQDKCV